MNKAKIVAVIVYLLVVAPIGYWLQYRILAAVQASELMWFLYWVSLPIAVVSGLIIKLSED